MNSTGNLVADKDSAKCKNGNLIKSLSEVQMGCYPKWQKIVIGVSAAVTVAVVVAIIAISRRWNEVKWFLYLHFDILDKHDGPENLANKTTDALLSYR